MGIFYNILHNRALICAVLGWFFAQILKVVYILIKEHRLDFRRLTGSGGMPSSHSAFVSALATSIGLLEGFDSAAFAVAFVLAFIVMYDASGVRKAAGDQAKVINTLQEQLMENAPVYLKELIGHTRLEVIVGCLLGVAIALVAYLIA